MPTNHTIGHLLHVIAAGIVIGLMIAVIRRMRRAR
jgi:hypothetical protein